MDECHSRGNFDWLPSNIPDGGGTSEPLETEGQELEKKDNEIAIYSFASEHVVSSSSLNTDTTTTINNNNNNNNNNNPIYPPDFYTLDNNLLFHVLVVVVGAVVITWKLIMQ